MTSFGDIGANGIASIPKNKLAVFFTERLKLRLQVDKISETDGAKVAVNSTTPKVVGVINKF